MTARDHIAPALAQREAPWQRWYPLLLLAGSLLLHAPHLFLQVGDINYDFYLHYNWAHEFGRNLLDGDVYPRWMFHGRLGLGEPVFITYSPLYFYSVALFKALGFSTWIGMQAVAILSDAAFAWFVTAAALRFMPMRIALPMAFALLLNPFLMMLHYKFHGLPWGSVGYLAHGMLVWALLRHDDGGRRFNLLAALAIALAVGTHIISALIIIVCYSACVLPAWSEAPHARLRALIRGASGWIATVTVGLLLSAVYLVPALYYLRVMNAASWVGQYRVNSFAWPVFTMMFGTPEWLGFQWVAVAPALLLFVLAVSYFLRHRRTLGRLHAPYLAMLGAAAISVVLGSELSYPLWTFQNPISQVNLPYRFISVTYVTVLFCIGLAAAHASAARADADHSVGRRWRPVLWTLLTLSTAIGALFLVKAAVLDGTPLPRSVLGNEATFVAARERFLTPDYPANCARDRRLCLGDDRSAAGFRGVPEYLLKWAGPGFEAYARDGLPARCRAIGATCSEPLRKGSGIDVVVSSERPVAVVLPLFAYPAWSVTVQGAAMPAQTDADTGLLRVDLPVGRSEVSVRWAPTGVERLGLAVTLVTLAGIAAALSLHRRRATTSPR